MAQFKYTAYDYQTNKVSGEITAKDIREARTVLKDKDLIPITIKELKGQTVKKLNNGKVSSSPLFAKKIKMAEVTLFSRQFATLIQADVPITRSLFILSQNTTNPSFRRVLEKVTDDIENGNSLSTSLSKHKKVFPPIYIDMVAAAEIGGALAEVLERLAQYLENDKSVKSKVKSAFIYPAVVMVIALIVVVVMLLFVIPNFIPLFEDLGAELPLPTRMLIGASNIMQQYWWLIGIIAAGLFVGLTVYKQTPTGRLQWDFIRLKLPIFGTLTLKTAIARFSRTLETLQRSGVPLVQSLGIVGKTSGNKIIENAIYHAVEALERGEGIAIPLEETKVFPLLVTQMLAIGEETGELEELLDKIANFYEEEVNTAVKNMTSLIEPIITVFLGVGIGFVALAIMMPMYEMMGAMQEQS